MNKFIPFGEEVVFLDDISFWSIEFVSLAQHQFLLFQQIVF